MTGETCMNLFFGSSELNTLILDAHITTRHSIIHKYALQMVQESDQRRQQKADHFRLLKQKKRNFGEKKKANKKKL
jgi:hypothetical protein